MNSDDIKQEVTSLFADGLKALRGFVNKKGGQDVRFEYQRWYTSALQVVATLAPDRLVEFRGYYEPDPKRKSLGYGTYVIQDYFKGVAPAGYSNFKTDEQMAAGWYNQLSMLESLVTRIDSVLGNIASTVIAEFQDAELETARQLMKVNVRAAGALAGVLLESHLQKVAAQRGVPVKKKNPTISDLNEPLRQAGVYDTPTWRKISYLADVRNLCTHKKQEEPTAEQVSELVEGVNWALKNIV